MSDWWREFDRRRNRGCMSLLIAFGGLLLPIPIIVIFHIPGGYADAVAAVIWIGAIVAVIIYAIKTRR